MKILFYSLLACTLFLVSCDNKDLMQSEKKVKSQLEAHSWKRIAPSSDNYHEAWSFQEGILTIVNDSDTISSTYFVDTKFSSSYVTMGGIPYPNKLTGVENVNLNLKWTIAEINDKVLYLSAATETGTIKSLEYIKQ